MLEQTFISGQDQPDDLLEHITFIVTPFEPSLDLSKFWGGGIAIAQLFLVSILDYMFSSLVELIVERRRILKVLSSCRMAAWMSFVVALSQERSASSTMGQIRAHCVNSHEPS